MTNQLRSFALASCLLTLTHASAQDAAEKKAPTFSKATADLGIVVSDLEASAKFYTEALGLTEVKGFSVPAEKATDLGLTDNQPATIRVFVLDPNADAKTSFKLMSFPDAPGAKQDQKFIHSTNGVSYLTLFVSDLSASVAKLKEHKVKLLGKTPAPIGGTNFLATVQDPDGNFIELIGPMK